MYSRKGIKRLETCRRCVENKAVSWQYQSKSRKLSEELFPCFIILFKVFLLFDVIFVFVFCFFYYDLNLSLFSLLFWRKNKTKSKKRKICKICSPERRPDELNFTNTHWANRGMIDSKTIELALVIYRVCWTWDKREKKKKNTWSYILS